MDARSQDLLGAAGPWIRGSRETGGWEAAADFTVEDANTVCELVHGNESLVVEKRRYLLSMLQGQDGRVKRVKRPEFMEELFLAESDVRGDELSCERVKIHVKRCFGLEQNVWNHHVVQDGEQLFKLQKEKDGSLSPESLKFVHNTINKLSLEALHSVACIVNQNRNSVEKTRPRMKKLVKNNLPAYLADLDNENNSYHQLSQILTNPSSYLSDCMSLATPVKPRLLSSLVQALGELDALPLQALVAMKRKLDGKSCSPRFELECQASTRQEIFKKVHRRCNKIISKLEEGCDLPTNLAKAMSVVNLCRKKELRCMDISLSEFFPFSRHVISLQNDVMNALWSLEKMRHDTLKLLHPMLCYGSKEKREHTKFRITVRKYLLECLFECDEGNLPEKALQVIAFFDRMSRHQHMLTEERKDVEVESVLNLSSNLRAIGCYDVAGDPINDQLMNSGSACISDDQLINLDHDDRSEDNDFVLRETNYFNFCPQQNIDEPCSSNSLHNTAVVSSRHSRDTEAAVSMMDSHLNKAVASVETASCSKDLHELCDETAVMAHKLIGQIIESSLRADTKEVDECTRGYLRGGSVSQGPQAPAVEDTQSADIMINAVKTLFPNLSESCFEKVRRILNGGEQ